MATARTDNHGCPKIFSWCRFVDRQLRLGNVADQRNAFASNVLDATVSKLSSAGPSPFSPGAESGHTGTINGSALCDADIEKETLNSARRQLKWRGMMIRSAAMHGEKNKRTDLRTLLNRSTQSWPDYKRYRLLYGIVTWTRQAILRSHLWLLRFATKGKKTFPLTAQLLHATSLWLHPMRPTLPVARDVHLGSFIASQVRSMLVAIAYRILGPERPDGVKAGTLSKNASNCVSTSSGWKHSIDQPVARLDRHPPSHGQQHVSTSLMPMRSTIALHASPPRHQT